MMCGGGGGAMRGADTRPPGLRRPPTRGACGVNSAVLQLQPFAVGKVETRGGWGSSSIGAPAPARGLRCCPSPRCQQRRGRRCAEDRSGRGGGQRPVARAAPAERRRKVAEKRVKRLSRRAASRRRGAARGPRQRARGADDARLRPEACMYVPRVVGGKAWRPTPAGGRQQAPLGNAMMGGWANPAAPHNRWARGCAAA